MLMSDIRAAIRAEITAAGPDINTKTIACSVAQQIPAGSLRGVVAMLLSHVVDEVIRQDRSYAIRRGANPGASQAPQLTLAGTEERPRARQPRHVTSRLKRRFEAPDRVAKLLNIPIAVEPGAGDRKPLRFCTAADLEAVVAPLRREAKDLSRRADFYDSIRLAMLTYNAATVGDLPEAVLNGFAAQDAA